jgi:cell division protease FtsH
MEEVAQKLPRRVTQPASRRVAGNWKLLAAFIAVIGAGLLALPFALPDRVEPSTLAYTELLDAIGAGRVASIEITRGDAIEGWWTDASRIAGAPADFVTVYPLESVETLLQRADAAGVNVSFRRATDPNLARNILAIALQVVLFGGIGYFLYLHVRGKGRQGEVGHRGTSSTSFADVAGTQGAAEDLREVIDFLKAPAAFTAMGARVPRGVLLYGPPGTGKTLLARAVAGEAGVPFFHLAGSEVTGFVVGLGAHRIRSLFARARKRGGVIFIDELDSLGGVRGRNRSHNEDDRTLNQLLVEMDGFAQDEAVIVIGATNRPEDIDPALQRPGRFDRLLGVSLPTVDGRAAILRLHAARRGVPLAGDVDLARLARLTPGASGAELANLLNEAAIVAVRERTPQVQWRHFEAARDRMLLGRERVDFRANAREWQIVAFHEAGHALAGVIACPEDPLHKVTIQPRGRAMGVAHFAPDDDRHLHTRHYLEGQIVKGLGGRVAEELVFGREYVTGGAESDLVHVNRVARQMIYRLGMADTGSLLIHDEQAGPLSAQAQAEMDAQVSGLLDRLHARTRELVAGHRAALEALAHALLERETLDGSEALALLAQHGVVLPAVTR